MTHTIGWAIIHSLWQAAGLALLLAAALQLTRQATPALRYRLALIAMMASVVAPLATVRLTDHRWGAAEQTASLRSESLIAPGDRASEPGATSRSAPAAAILADRERESTLLTEARLRVDAVLPLVVALWVAGLLVFAARLGSGLAGVRRLARAPDVSPLPPGVARAAAQLAQRLRLRGPVPMRVTAHVNVPIVVGYVRPLVLLPVALVTGLPPAQLEALIAHELAHVRRHDVLVNLLQRVIETLLFYHPAVWWISARVRDERESCCDADAVRACRGDIASYASALLALEERHEGQLITALAASHGPLLRRIERLVHGRSASAELGVRWAAGVLGLLALLLVSSGVIRVPGATAAPVAERTGTAGRDSTLPIERSSLPSPVPAVAGRTLDERWHRAQRAAAAGGSYWLAWSVAGSADRRYRYHVDDSVSIRIDGERVRGRVRLRDSIALRASVPGRSLAPIIGAHAATDLVVLVGYDPTRGRNMQRLRAASFELPAVLGDRRVIWLGPTDARESIARLQALFADAPKRHRRSLVAAIGMHADQHQAVAALSAIVSDAAQPDGVREEAVRWLAHHATGASVAALTRTARSADDRDVREEAIEGLAEHDHPAATDSLLALSRSLDHDGLRETAIEALGERGPKAVAPLVAMLNTGSDAGTQSAAVEALAEIGNAAGLRAVRDAAQHHPNPRVRRRALRELAGVASPEDAIALLLVALETDPDHDVRSDAVRALRRVRPASYAVAALTSLALEHERRDVRQRAVRTLGDMRRHNEARVALRTLADTSDDDRVRSVARAELRGR